MGGSDIDLGDVMFRRRLRVDERAIVRHQQQARGVMVESANRLYIAPGKLIGKDGQHPGMMAGLA